MACVLLSKWSCLILIWCDTRGRCVIAALPIDVNNAVTLWAVFADVSKKSKPASSAYSWAVYCTTKDTCVRVSFVSFAIICQLVIPIPLSQQLFESPSRFCCLQAQLQYLDLLGVAIHSPTPLPFPEKPVEDRVSNFVCGVLTLHSNSRFAWYHIRQLRNSHCDNTSVPNSAIIISLSDANQCFIYTAQRETTL